MAKFNGVVQKVYEKTFDDGNKAYSIKLEGSPLYFRMGKKRNAGTVEPGNTIEFFGEQTDEKSAKVTSEITASKKAAPQETSQAATGGKTYGSGSNGGDDRNASIVYQSSRKDALTLVGILLQANAVAVPAAAAKKLAFIEALVDRYTSSFIADVGSQGAVSRAVPAEKPKAVVKDEWEGDEDEG